MPGLIPVCLHNSPPLAGREGALQEMQFCVSNAIAGPLGGRAVVGAPQAKLPSRDARSVTVPKPSTQRFPRE